MAINVVLWLAIAGKLGFDAFADEDMLGLIFVTIGLVMALVISLTAQIVIHLLVRRRRLHWALRSALFFVPTAVLIALPFVIPLPPPPPNQVQPSRSPSGKYVLTVPIERNPNSPHNRVWTITISTPEGTVLYKDESSAFAGHLNGYWAWDDSDRAWFYNSDDSHVYFWELDGTKWAKTYWGYGRDKREIDRTIDQPKILYPYDD